MYDVGGTYCRDDEACGYHQTITACGQRAASDQRRREGSPVG